MRIRRFFRLLREAHARGQIKNVHTLRRVLRGAWLLAWMQMHPAAPLTPTQAARRAHLAHLN